jgi:putative membrane protein
MPGPAWRHEGTEPDSRFTLADERTFLAWIRTALALLSGGVLLHQFGGVATVFVEGAA